MTDIRLTGGDVADLSLTSGDISTDDGLDNAVLLSLFLDRRAQSGDMLPDDDTDRRGWWGDAFGGAHGSRLWLLDRSKTTDQNLKAAQIYAEEALGWLVEEGVAKSVSVLVAADSGAIRFTVSIDRVSGGKYSARYGFNWREKATANGVQ